MKMKRVLIGFALIVVCAISMFTLTACGDVSLKTLKENFEALDKVYAGHSTIFEVGTFEGIENAYIVKYGDTIDGFISSGTTGFQELKVLYNATFAISNDYIQNNRTLLLNLNEEQLTKAQHKAIDQLNSKLVKFTKSIDGFVKARADMVEYFEWFGNTATSEDIETHLREFKRAYGEFVSKNIEVSTSIAKVVEEVDVFAILEKKNPIANDSVVIKEYVRAKLLPIFSTFMIDEIANSINWNSTAQTETKTRIDNILSTLKTLFESLKSNFVVKSNDDIKTLKDSEVKTLLNQIEAFFVEADAYYQAVEGFDTKALAGLTYDNDLGAYKKSNKMAEVYLNKIEEFVEISLSKFMNTVIDTVY